MGSKQVIAEINKKFGAGSIAFAKDVEMAEVTRSSSGSSFLDWALGITEKGAGGWALGRVVELYGNPSSGKSFIALKTIVEAQKKKMLCAYLDCEGTFDGDYAEALGVDTSKLLLSQESVGESVIDIMAELLKKGDVKIIVVDSVASMVPQAEIDDPMKKAQMAESARIMSRGLRKLIALNKNNTLLMFINQIRTKPGCLYGNPEYTPGGNALKFYSSIRLEVRKGDWLFENKKRVGQGIKFKVTKNKTSTPFKNGYFNYIYKMGIDKVDELISMGLLSGKLKQRGAFFYIPKKDGEEAIRGRDGLYEVLTKEPKKLEIIKKLIFDKK